MNQTYMGAINSVESAYSFIKDQVDDYNKKLFKKQRRNKALVRQTVTVSMAIVLTLISALPHAMGAAVVSETEAQPVFTSTIELDKSTTLLSIKDQTTEIKPGKSLAQEEAERKAREARKSVASTKPKVAGSSAAVSISTEEAHQMARLAAEQMGIGQHWKILAAVWQAESGKTKYRCYGSKYEGPLQFALSTFNHYAAPGADICDAKDALPAAANLLKSAGLDHGDVTSALLSYNHSMAYAARVEAIANSIQ